MEHHPFLLQGLFPPSPWEPPGTTWWSWGDNNLEGNSSGGVWQKTMVILDRKGRGMKSWRVEADGVRKTKHCVFFETCGGLIYFTYSHDHLLPTICVWLEQICWGRGWGEGGWFVFGECTQCTLNRQIPRGRPSKIMVIKISQLVTNMNKSGIFYFIYLSSLCTHFQ